MFLNVLLGSIILVPVIATSIYALVALAVKEKQPSTAPTPYDNIEIAG